MNDFPRDLFYDPGHTWVNTLDDGTVRIGLTDHAQEELGDIVFVELPTPHSRFARDQECGVIESVKSTSDLRCPLSGEVVTVNQDLEENPAWVNSAPYDNGWLFQLRPDDTAELEQLLDESSYRRLIQGD